MSACSLCPVDVCLHSLYVPVEVRVLTFCSVDVCLHSLCVPVEVCLPALYVL
jgi:hypothetical protein